MITGIAGGSGDDEEENGEEREGGLHVAAKKGVIQF